MLKIVYITSARLPTEKAHGVQIVRMCEAFAATGAEVTLLHPYRDQPDPEMRGADVIEYYQVKHPFTVRTLPIWDRYRAEPWLPGRVYSLFAVTHTLLLERSLAREAAGYDADLFYFRDATPFAAKRLASQGRPTVIEFHGKSRGTAARALKGAIRSPGFRLGVSVTRHLQGQIQAALGLPKEKSVVLHDGVDLNQFAIAPRPTASRARPKVCYVGSMLKNRGVETLLATAALCPALDFEVVGGLPDQVAEMESLAKSAGAANVLFRGQVKPAAVPALMSGADVLVLPMSGKDQHTMYYASPMKLFEYMASGIPIVASDLPSLREVVEHRKSAYLVKPDGPQEMKRGIETVLADPEMAKSIGEQARRQVGDFTWDKRARSILERLTIH